MATTSTAINYAAMCDRVNALRDSGHNKAAADAGGVEDPRNKGTASIPNHPDGDNAAKTKIPEGSRPVNTTSVDDGVTHHVTQPGGTGEHQPAAPADGNAKEDAFNSPTASLDKIAAAATALKALRDNGSTAPAAPAPNVEKVAGEIELSDDAQIKLASEILADEEGRQWAADFLTERHGEKVAHTMIQDAGQLHQEMEKAAAEQAYMAKEAAHEQDGNIAYVNEMLKEASPAQREVFMKCATAHNDAIVSNYGEDYEAQSLYKAGAADAGMAQEMMMAEGGDPGMPALPGSEGVDDEQIMQVIAAMVQSGELQPEEAEAILASLGGGAAPEGEVPPEAAAAGPPMEEMPKVASAAAITQEVFGELLAAK